MRAPHPWLGHPNLQKRNWYDFLSPLLFPITLMGAMATLAASQLNLRMGLFATRRSKISTRMKRGVTYKSRLQTLGAKGIWMLDEVSGNASDSSGNSYTGTAEGTPTYRQAIGSLFGIGTNGGAGRFIPGDIAALELEGGAFSVGCIVKPDAVAQAPGVLVSKLTDGNYEFSLNVIVNSSGQVTGMEVYVFQQGTTSWWKNVSIGGLGPYSAGIPHLIGAEVDASNNLIGYIDGVEVGRNMGGPTGIRASSGTGPVVIGSYGDAARAFKFKGVMAGAFIAQGALGASEWANLNALANGNIGASVFSYTGSAQTITVPTGAKSAIVDLYGAEGGTGGNGGNTPGKGARLIATLPVTSGEVLQILVGGKGANGLHGASSAGGAGGFNGGAVGGSSGSNSGSSSGGGGGGATDIRRGAFALADRIAVAAGAGGSGGFGSAAGGLGGQGGGTTGGAGGNGDTGSQGLPTGGGGGTQSAGGAAGTPTASTSAAGTLGVGGKGGNGSGGGGAGGGYYGGGGGAGSNDSFSGSGAGGGGGSSYVDPISVSVAHTQGARTGHGLAVVTFSPLPVLSPLDLTALISNGGYKHSTLVVNGSELDFTFYRETVDASHGGKHLSVPALVTAEFEVEIQLDSYQTSSFGQSMRMGLSAANVTPAQFLTWPGPTASAIRPSLSIDINNDTDTSAVGNLPVVTAILWGDTQGQAAVNPAFVSVREGAAVPVTKRIRAAVENGMLNLYIDDVLRGSVAAPTVTVSALDTFVFAAHNSTNIDEGAIAPMSGKIKAVRVRKAA